MNEKVVLPENVLEFPISIPIGMKPYEIGRELPKGSPQPRLHLPAILYVFYARAILLSKQV